MTITLHEISVPAFVRGLNVLSSLLDKADAHAQAQGFDVTELINARLAPDMYSVVGQVQGASDAAKFGAARVAGVTPPSFPDNETTFDELKVRIANTVSFLESLEPAQFEGGADREVQLKTPSKTWTFTGRDYLRAFALPNFYFHVTTAYDILRHKGVAIGKMDYLGPF